MSELQTQADALAAQVRARQLLTDVLPVEGSAWMMHRNSYYNGINYSLSLGCHELYIHFLVSQVKALELVNADNVSLEKSNQSLEQQLSSTASPQVSSHLLFSDLMTSSCRVHQELFCRS